MASFCFSVLDFLFLCIFWEGWFQYNTDAHQGGCRGVKFITPVNGHYLKGHVFLNLSIGMNALCRHRCVLESDCVSVNIGPLINDEVVCELSNSDHWHHPKDLIPKQGWTYRGAENLCYSNPCRNNAKCLLGYTAKKYLCVCAPGYTGEHCEKDIDECSNGSHDCHENANCINTSGHFNCSCQPGFAGDGRNCSDCSSNFHHFEKHQDLPTRGAVAVEQFRISGSLFLAFANYRTDTEVWNTVSFIYKLNDLTGKFSLYQTINTTGGHNMKYFAIADRHYLAVANHYNHGYLMNSVVYRWDGHQFVLFQKIATKGATSFNFFKIMKDMFLAVTNYYDGSTHNINSVVYKWNNSKFETFQKIGTEGARASAAFVINNETFIAFANEKLNKSTVFKWSGQQFVKLQSFQTYGAQDVKAFNINGHTFLAFASSELDSFIYKWNGTHFVHFQSIPTRGAFAWHPFVMCGQTYLGVANYNIKSVVYQYSGSQFSEYQNISTHGAYDMTSFKYKGHTYLAVANHKNNEGKRNINSTLYKWT